MIQPTQRAAQGSSRNSKNLRGLSLILVRFLIDKTDVPFHRTCQRDSRKKIGLSALAVSADRL